MIFCRATPASQAGKVKQLALKSQQKPLSHSDRLVSNKKDCLCRQSFFYSRFTALSNLKKPCCLFGVIGDQQVRTGALHAEQGLHHHPITIDPALFRRHLNH